jgi:thioredoxin reductase/ferredoxin
VNLGYQFTIGKKVVVIGGGNVAMDVARSAAREVVRQHEASGATPSEENLRAEATHEMVDISLSALRLGATEVHIVCLERREEMPADLFEIEEAETEGITLNPGLGPKAIVGNNDRVSGLQTMLIKSLRDAQGRFNPSFVDGSESVIECDTVILAIGQTPNLEFLKAEDKVEVSNRGLIVADPRTLMTSSPGIFAGGDCVFGPRLIIDSVGDGKRAAVGIDEFLRGQLHPEPTIEVEHLPLFARSPQYMSLDREAVPMLPLDRRTGMTEVEIGYDEESAKREASRCLQCWINTVMEGCESDGTECVLCGGCVDVCPEDCFTLAPLESLELPEPVLAHIAANEELYQYELNGVKPEELGKISGSVMIKDESRCIRCGLCALRCPVGTITMEAYNIRPAEPTGLIPIQSFDIAREAKAVGR